jgi:hypothetical protein
MFALRTHRLVAALGAASLVSSLLVANTAAAESLRDIDLSANSRFALNSVSFPTDPRFTQLLGINDKGTIAGYHGDENTEMTPNKGFTLKQPANFTDENFPNSAQTQVIGINNNGNTDGFYIDQAGNTHGFLKEKGHQAETVDLPGTTFNQLLGINNNGQEAGYFQDAAGLQHGYIREKDGSFLVLNLPMPSSQATGVNDKGTVVGFLQTSPTATTAEGFILKDGHLTELKAFDSAFTQALGVDNDNDVVGTYTDANGTMHGFLYAEGHYETIEARGAQSTVINWLNNRGHLVGFYMDQDGNTVGLLVDRKSS